MYNHNKAQQSKNRVHISWDILYNNVDGRCVLLPIPCTLALRRQTMDHTIFTGINHEQCMKWVPFPGSYPTIFRVLESPDGYLTCRMNINHGIFVGHFVFQNGGCYATDDSSQYFSLQDPLKSKKILPSVQGLSTTTQKANNYHSMPCASYQIRKIADCACAGNAGNVFPGHGFQRKPLISDPGMQHDTFVKHVPWWM